MSELLRLHIHFPSFEKGCASPGLILCLCGAFPASPLWRFSLSFLFTPDGTSFNIQNPIPHPSQKEKVLLETRRAKECQRGIAGAAERAKEGGRVPFESSDTRLGPHSQTFEPHTPDQTLPNRAKEHQTSAKSSGLSLPFFSISCNPKCGNIPKTPTT